MRNRTPKAEIKKLVNLIQLFFHENYLSVETERKSVRNAHGSNSIEHIIIHERWSIVPSGNDPIKRSPQRTT